MVPDFSNRMMSLAGSGFKMEVDHLNILIVDSSVCFNASTLLNCGNVSLDTNILKVHAKRVPTFEKIPQYKAVRTEDVNGPRNSIALHGIGE